MTALAKAPMPRLWRKASLLRAIRAKCLDCAGHERKGVAECVSTTCQLWRLRSARALRERPGTMPKRDLWLAVRGFCLDCGGGQRREVVSCPVESCPVWPYRAGRRNVAPQRAEATVV